MGVLRKEEEVKNDDDEEEEEILYEQFLQSHILPNLSSTLLASSDMSKIPYNRVMCVEGLLYTLPGTSATHRPSPDDASEVVRIIFAREVRRRPVVPPFLVLQATVGVRGRGGDVGGGRFDGGESCGGG